MGSKEVRHPAESSAFFRPSSSYQLLPRHQKGSVPVPVRVQGNLYIKLLSFSNISSCVVGKKMLLPFFLTCLIFCAAMSCAFRRSLSLSKSSSSMLSSFASFASCKCRQCGNRTDVVVCRCWSLFVLLYASGHFNSGRALRNICLKTSFLSEIKASRGATSSDPKHQRFIPVCDCKECKPGRHGECLLASCSASFKTCPKRHLCMFPIFCELVSISFQIRYPHPQDSKKHCGDVHIIAYGFDSLSSLSTGGRMLSQAGGCYLLSCGIAAWENLSGWLDIR